MRYTDIKDKKASDFKRLTGVKKKTFYLMCDVLRQTESLKQVMGRPRKLSLEDQLLLTLCYWREYRTQFHIAASYDMHESSINRIIRKVENRLTESGKFKLPKKREVQKQDWIVVLVDAADIPIERPKKNNESTTQAKGSIIA
jgi:hypothetical protein